MTDGGDKGGTYTVKSGDTFRGIANRLRIPYKDLEKANPGINDYNNIDIGQVINIPKKKAATKVAERAGAKIGPWIKRLREEGKLSTKTTKAPKDEFEYDAAKFIDEVYMPELFSQENEGKAGYDPETELWYPTKAPEEGGGYDIFGGHKVGKYEDFSEGITTEQGHAQMRKDFESKKKNAAKYINKTYGEGTFESLPIYSQAILTDYEYNVKGGIGTFKNFARGVVKNDKDLMLKEYVRYSDGKPLGRRNDMTLNWINKYYKKPGGFVSDDPPEKTPLQVWNEMQKSKWKGIKEDSPQGRALIKQYNDSIGTHLSYTQPWSAITISNAVMQNVGAKDLDSLKQAGFNPSIGHWSYIMDSFKAKNDPNYKYNRYVANKPDGNYKVGDILVKGRKKYKDGKYVGPGSSKWTYEDFAKRTKHSYPSHGDIIVDQGSDNGGDYVIIAGGNVGDTYINKKIYVKDVGSKYKVKLVDNAPQQEQLDIQVPDVNMYQDNTRVVKKPVANIFQQDGGFVADLTEDQVKMYTQGGYIVEEIN